MEDNSRYRDLFFEETDEYLQTLDDCILELEQNPENEELLDEIFRAAHTLKGMAATMGYNTMAELTHRMENVFELFRSKAVSVNSDIISLIFKCLDKLADIVEDLRNENDVDHDIDSLLNELDKVGKDDQPVEEEKAEEEEVKVSTIEVSSSDIVVIEEANAKGLTAFKVNVSISEDCMLKAARAFLIINKLNQDGEIISTDPAPNDLEEGKYDKGFSLIYLTEKSLEQVKEEVEDNVEVDGAIVEKLDPKVETKKLEYREKAKEQAKKTKDKQKKKSSKTRGSEYDKAIRVSLSRLDAFMNLVSELVIYRTRLEDINSKYSNLEIDEPLAQVAKITSELQDLVLKIRMQPVSTVMNRFPRMVRDLSKDLGKDINLVIEGEETELDRTVVSELGEPLVHLIRNAADHGIESVEKRILKGKPAEGTITLSAYHEGNRVVIVVADDGKGIDPQAIKASAEKKGIKTDGLSDKELIQLIFHQGFTTVENVTNVSGRGVGMDVVRQKISSLGGDIQVISKIDEGTSFIIKLPLTLSIIQSLMVKVGGETFALPLGIIERVIKVEDKQIEKSHNGEVYMYRDLAVPVVRLNKKLNLKANEENNHIILINIGEKYYGLIVDSLIGQQEIVIKKLGLTLSHMKEYLGATILGNGDIILILDIENIVENHIGDSNE